MNCKQIVIALISCVFVGMSAAAASWEIESNQDPITDELAYHAHTFGTEINSRSGSFVPQLIVRIIPTDYIESSGKMTFTPDVYIWSPAIKRKTQSAKVNVITRYDKTDPQTSTWVGSDNLCAIFCDDPTNTILKIHSSNSLAMRFEHNGITHTTIFDLSGFKSAYSEIKKSYLVKIGKLKEQPTAKKRPPTYSAESAKIFNRQIRQSARRSARAEADAIAHGYSTSTKSKFNAKRQSTETK